jgi:hypothetical protein
MNERVVEFGDGTSLMGIVTEPDEETNQRGPVAILLNAGTLHRIGPHRLYVKLARQLAAGGMSALRFDLSGLGDSAPRRDNLPYRASVLRETKDAMDYLTGQGYGREFVLVGLCGGADAAFRVACADARVVGAVLIDWYTYRTMGWYVRRFGAPMTNLAGWREAFSGSGPLRQRIGRLAPWINRHGGRVLNDGEVPTRREATADLHRLVARGVNLFFAFTGGQYGYYNYTGQFRDAFRSVPFRERLSVAYYPDADHTFTLLHHQRQIIDAIHEWAAGVGWATGMIIQAGPTEAGSNICGPRSVGRAVG